MATKESVFIYSQKSGYGNAAADAHVRYVREKSARQFSNRGTQNRIRGNSPDNPTDGECLRDAGVYVAGVRDESPLAWCVSSRSSTSQCFRSKLELMILT